MFMSGFGHAKDRIAYVLAPRTVQTIAVTRNENVEVFFPQMVKILGHRGNPARYADNELAGIREAADLADGAEVDVRRCGSGELVLAHDPVIGDSIIAETGLDALLRLDADLATAEDLFAADVPGMLDLEVKNSPLDPGFEGDHAIAFEVAERARSGDLVTCFHWPSVDAVAARFPDVDTGLLMAIGDPADAVAHAVRAGHGWIAPHHELISSSDVVDLAHASGLSVAAWTVNDRERVHELVRYGIDTIITDTPLEAVPWAEEFKR